MDDLQREIRALGEDWPTFVFLMKFLGLIYLTPDNYESFLRQHEHDLHYVFPNNKFWELKVKEERLVEGKSVPQIQYQIVSLLHIVVGLARHEHALGHYALDASFSTIQNAYLILTTLGSDRLPIGAYNRFQPWQLVEMGLHCSLYGIQHPLLSGREQSVLAAHLDRQYLKLQRIFPIRSDRPGIAWSQEFHLVGAGFLSEEQEFICSNEQQERFIIDSTILCERFPVLQKPRYRIYLTIISIYPRIPDNDIGKDICKELFEWISAFSGEISREQLSEAFQMPDLTPEELAVILATMLAFSKIFTKWERNARLTWNLPYDPVTFEQFHRLIQDPSELEYSQDIMETAISSFRAVLPSYVGEKDLAVIYEILNPINHHESDSPVLEPAFHQYWAGRLGDRSPTTILLADMPDLCEPGSRTLIELDRLSICSAESFKELPPPQYLTESNLLGSIDKDCGDKTFCEKNTIEFSDVRADQILVSDREMIKRGFLRSTTGQKYKLFSISRMKDVFKRIRRWR